jgi:dihydroorotase
LETALAVNLTWLVAAKRIDLKTLIEKMSCAPARVFKLPGGTLRKGGAADITVFDPDVEWTVDPAAFKSKGRNTPYTGKKLRGRVRWTLVGGTMVHEAAG